MATSNETISDNSTRAAQPATKRKTARKSAAASREQAAPARPKRAPDRSKGPVETLFTQAPNPYRDPVPPYIWIDHPLQNEILGAPHYVVRLGVGGADLVEMSIDKSPWIPCRLASGYWWFDWSGIAHGKHTLVARMRTSDGRWFKTPPRLCDYRSE